ncbi:MAG: aminotransferase class I/II-fold pyridoxal phosphate-dependent enzyme [Candidatus Marinimicrobia bacterium]|jgi:aspartate/methionine/tyrosine aminotransferase|nr:aminotransferase class I/II-fold pyridoxal phosphate-dependent enzyme [Candidatus Neomarinimicrobiota bacterium]
MFEHISVNQNLIEMEYAVRGKISQRAAELEQEGQITIACNIGNPQALGQKPITFYRQVLSLLEYPNSITRERELSRHLNTLELSVDSYSDTVLNYAEDMLEKMKTGTGAYTESKGPLFIREAIAEFIDKRDDSDAGSGNGSDPESIFLTNGASDAARRILEILISDKSDGIMIPIPQYPLYSATIKRCGGTQVNYFLDEDSDWSVTSEILSESYDNAEKSEINIKAIVVINPGNPTGSILDEESIGLILDFAEKHDLAIIADEVYQDNLYGGSFTSFAKGRGTRNILLFSLHSTSKGFHGECGHRGGYVEIRSNPEVNKSGIKLMDIFLKQASVSLCSNTIGQCLTYMMATPPEKGTNAFALYASEKTSILTDLEEKASMIIAAFKKMEGVKCFGRTGAMYLFPRIDHIPEGTNDFDYCMALLEETGLCTVNGEGFGQREGTNHLRIAFLPPITQLQEVLPQWIAFHNDYISA